MDWPPRHPGIVESVLRTRLSYERLHRLLYIFFNSRALPDAHVDAATENGAEGTCSDGAGGEGVG